LPQLSLLRHVEDHQVQLEHQIQHGGTAPYYQVGDVYLQCHSNACPKAQTPRPAKLDFDCRIRKVRFLRAGKSRLQRACCTCRGAQGIRRTGVRHHEAMSCHWHTVSRSTDEQYVSLLSAWYVTRSYDAARPLRWQPC